MVWYKSGTINVTNNSDVITGSGTDFVGRVKVGDALVMGGAGIFEVKTVDSLTQITLARPYTGTTESGASYAIHPTSSFDKQVATDLISILDSIGPARADIEFLNEYVGAADANLQASIAALANVQSLRDEVVSKEASTQAAYSATVTAKNTATTKRDEAVAAATAASGSAADALASKNAAYTSEINALGSKNAAGTSATNAAASADTALTNKNAAVTAKDAAVTAKTAAEAAQASANTSATNAHNSKLAAGVSEINASASATTATDASDDAISARDLAQGYKNEALTAKSSATSSAADAQAAQTAAETARDLALQYKGTAETARDTAIAKALDANTQADIATDQAAIATDAAEAAGISETNSATSETNAADSEAAALSAKSAAESARDLANGYKDDAGQSASDAADSAAAAATWNPANYAALAGATFTGTVNGITKSMVGLGNVDNKSSATIRNEITQSNVTTGLGWMPVQQGTGIGQGTNAIKIGWSGSRLKITVDSTDQGNVVFDGHLTKAAVGLSNVDNTSDANKPVSTIVQTHLDLKLGTTGGTMTGKLFVAGNGAGNSGIANATGGEIEIRGNGTGAAMMAFHRPGAYAVYFGLDTDNQLKFGGWSAGAVANTIYHSGTGAATFKGLITSSSTGLNAGIKLANTTGGRDWRVIQKDQGTFVISDETAGQERISINAAGLTSINNGLYLTNELSVFGNNQAYFKSNTGSNPTAIHRNDGSNYYILFSDASAGINNNWNGMRPFQIDMNNGRLKSNQGQDFAGGQLLTGGTTINAAATVNGNFIGSEIYTNNWFRVNTDAGIFWQNRGRGIVVADNGANYGNINIYGAGVGGWVGYAIGSSATFMASADTRGIYNAQNGHWCVNWDNAGNAVFPANITAYSDRRLKKNIRPIDNVAARREAMAKASALYERDGETRVGFIAQDLEQLMPEVVRKADDLLETLSVNYMDTIAVLAADNQQQAEQITSLEARLSALEALIMKAGI